MKKTFNISGMTCLSCQKFIESKISSLPNVDNVLVSFENEYVEIHSKSIIDDNDIQKVIGSKYSIDYNNKNKSKSKLSQLKPLFLIFIYLVFGTYFLNYNSFTYKKSMTDFMGLFFLVFSFFKFLDYSTFPISFSKYDPIAKKSILYAKAYPFLELILAICFLFDWKIKITSLITFCILLATTLGVIKSLFSKDQIECACLGTSMKLPMTEATLIENIIMISMASSFLI